MDVPRAVILVLTLGALNVTAQNATDSTPALEVTAAENITTTATPVQRNCSTAHGIRGTCVLRNDCDYSTPAIDLTLYAPRWYKMPCSLEEVCCPPDALVTQNTKFSANNMSDFENDDDDFI